MQTPPAPTDDTGTGCIESNILRKGKACYQVDVELHSICAQKNLIQTSDDNFARLVLLNQTL